MRKITIQYRPFRELKFTRYITGNFPSEWNETTPKQLIAIACLLKRSISDIVFLSIMTSLPKRMIKKLDDYQRFQLIELFDSFNSTKPYNEFVLEKIDCKGIILVRPKPKLKGVTFGQFIFMDTHFNNYQESLDVQDLDKFIAATYLPSGQTFAEHILDANLEWVANTGLVTKEAVVINYHLIREWLSLVYPLIFEKQAAHEGVNTGKDKTHSPKPKRDPNGWIKIFDGFVGDDIVNEDRYGNLPLHNVLRHLTGRIKQNMKNKK